MDNGTLVGLALGGVIVYLVMTRSNIVTGKAPSSATCGCGGGGGDSGAGALALSVASGGALCSTRSTY